MFTLYISGKPDGTTATTATTATTSRPAVPGPDVCKVSNFDTFLMDPTRRLTLSAGSTFGLLNRMHRTVLSALQTDGRALRLRLMPLIQDLKMKERCFSLELSKFAQEERDILSRFIDRISSNKSWGRLFYLFLLYFFFHTKRGRLFEGGRLFQLLRAGGSKYQRSP